MKNGFVLGELPVRQQQEAPKVKVFLVIVADYADPLPAESTLHYLHKGVSVRVIVAGKEDERVPHESLGCLHRLEQ